MMSLRIDINHNEIVGFCRRHHIQKLSFFGSVLGVISARIRTLMC